MPEFVDDEEGYLAWLINNPEGYVLNLRRRIPPDNVVLHKATCGGISSLKRKPGAYTCRGYRKICEATIEELQFEEIRQMRKDRKFFKRCGNCHP